MTPTPDPPPVGEIERDVRSCQISSICHRLLQFGSLGKKKERVDKAVDEKTRARALRAHALA